MDTPMPKTGDDKSLDTMQAALEAEISYLAKQGTNPNPLPQTEKALEKQASSPTLAPQIENSAERIRASVARLTSNSIEDLEGLKSELQKLQEFLNFETQRVQHEIESALAGITIIVETIAPWKNTTASVTPSNIARAVRARPPVDATQSRVGERSALGANPSFNRT